MNNDFVLDKWITKMYLPQDSKTYPHFSYDRLLVTKGYFLNDAVYCYRKIMCQREYNFHESMYKVNKYLLIEGKCEIKAI